MPDIFSENTFSTLQLPGNSSLINYSILKEFYSPKPFRSFSIKYVVNGSELYSVNGTKYIIENRQYLLANKFSEGFVEVDSKRSVTGICIDVSPEILSEVVSSYLQPSAAVSDLALDHFFNSPHFLENKYSAQNTALGKFMLQLEEILANNLQAELNFNEEFYFLLSEKIVADHIPLYKQLQSVKALKTETRKDLLRKVMKGKQYMDQHFSWPLNTRAIATEAGLSEYHFYRLFKSVFQMSPHQYLLNERLQFAKTLLLKERPEISNLAALSGFSDIYSFSKAFKKHFGIAPSACYKN